MSEYGWSRRRSRNGRSGGEVPPAPVDYDQLFEDLALVDDDDRSADESGGQDRVESFLVRLRVDREGRAVRSSVVHVRSTAEHHERGWPSGGVTAFIADCARLVPGSPASRNGECSSGLVDAGSTSDSRPPSPAPSDPAADADVPTQEKVSTAGEPGAGAEEALTILLDGGLHIGGRPEDVEVRFSTLGLNLGGFTFRASLFGRAVNDHPPKQRPWLPLGHIAGRGDSGGRLDLGFPQVHMSRGLHRLRVRVEMLVAVRPSVAPLRARPPGARRDDHDERLP
jgi:hypothetical protein